MQRIDITNLLDEPLDKGRQAFPDYEKGKQCFILDTPKVSKLLKEEYGRDDAVLKIFFLPLKDDQEPKDYYWGTKWRNLSRDRTEEIGYISKLGEATVVQNLCWVGGYAPRVYDLIKVKYEDKFYPAQVVEYIEGDIGVDNKMAYIEKLEKYLKKFGCLPVHKELVRDDDFIDNKLIDFQGFRFGKDYKKKIKKFVRTKGKYGQGHYQSVPELGLGSHPRDTQKRIEYMKFKDIDWQGKSVLDIGCNSGMFCNYAYESGSKRVLGIDHRDNIIAAKVLAIYLGNYNIDYKAMDVANESIKQDFDIVLFLSMNIHVGFHKWIADITNELLVFEENAKGSRFKPDWWKKELGKYFDSVKLVGYGKDHGNKPIFHAKK